MITITPAMIARILPNVSPTAWKAFCVLLAAMDENYRCTLSEEQIQQRMGAGSGNRQKVRGTLHQLILDRYIWKWTEHDTGQRAYVLPEEWRQPEVCELF